MSTGSSAAGGIDANTAVRGALYGAGGFLATYVLTFLLWTVAELPEPGSFEEAFQQAIVGSIRDSVPAWKAAGYVQFNAHAVELTFETVISDGSLDLISLAEGSGLVLAYLVPPLVLLGVGYLAASSADVANAGQAAAAGALVTIGYAILAVVLALVVAHDAGGTSLSIAIPNALVLAGIVWPVVFGGIGGALTDVL